MNLPDDLKDYKAPLGAFQILDPDTAAFVVILIIGALAIFWPYL